MESANSNKQKQLYCQLKAFFGKENQPQVTEVIRVHSEAQQPTNKSHRKNRIRVIAQDSPFGKRSRQQSPEQRRSPSFAAVVQSDCQAVRLFFNRLKTLIDVDRRIVRMKNVLGSRTHQSELKKTRQELCELINAEELEVSPEEFVPECEQTDSMPKASQYLAEYSKAQKEFTNLLEQLSAETARQVFSQLDYHSRGHVDLYDVTREASVNTGCCYKPGDLYLFFRRLSKGGRKRVTEQEWMAIWSETTMNN